MIYSNARSFVQRFKRRRIVDLVKLSTIGLSEKVAQTLASPLVNYIEPQPHPAMVAARIMETKLNDFDYGISVVIDALNEIAKIHPFVASELMSHACL